jgi:hypothetical protein
MDRLVSRKTKWEVLKKRPIPLLIGLCGTLIPLFLSSVLFVVFSSIENSSGGEVNYDEVVTQGRLTAGKIIKTEIIENISINNQHPIEVTYQFERDGKNSTSTVQTLDSVIVSELQQKTNIDIKFLDNESIVVGLMPYSFGMGHIYLFPLPFLMIALPFLFFATSKARKEINLFKYGVVREARILEMRRKAGLPVSGIGEGVVVYYQYLMDSGKENLAESQITSHILNEKKSGDVIKIFVDPNDDSSSCIISKLEDVRNGWNVL